MRLSGQPVARRSRVWVSQVKGSTALRRAVISKVAMVAQVRPPPLLPAKSAFLRRMAWAGSFAQRCWSRCRCGRRPGSARTRCAGAWRNGWPRRAWICPRAWAAPFPARRTARPRSAPNGGAGYQRGWWRTAPGSLPRSPEAAPWFQPPGRRRGRRP